MSRISSILGQEEYTYTKLRQIYPTASETFKKLPLIEHKINDDFTPDLEPLNLRDNLTTPFEVWNYSRLTLTANRILKLLQDEDKEIIDKELAFLSEFEPLQLYLEDLDYMEDPNEEVAYALFNLAKFDPDFLLTYLSADDWGINSTKSEVRAGAINLLALVLKNIKSQMSEIDKNNSIDGKDKAIFSMLQTIEKLVKPRLFDQNEKVKSSAEGIKLITQSLHDKAIETFAKIQKAS